jgi:antitoxin CptB
MHYRAPQGHGRHVNEFSRLRWRCRRGMRELDVVLLRYLENIYPEADPEEQAAFRRCLDLQDPEILAFLTGRQQCSDRSLAGVVEKIRRTVGPAAP